MIGTTWGWVLVIVLTLVVVPATPAAAHEVGGVGATNFRTTLSDLKPAVAGLSLRVIENGSRLELRNDTSTDVVVAGYGSEPYARIGPGGTFVNDNSPATYLNTDRFATATVPTGLDASAPPRWRQVSGEAVLRWHDHRTHWMLSSLPPVVAQQPAQPHRISSWQVSLDYGGQTLTAAGSLDWIPGPTPWPWFVLVALLVSAVAGSVVLRRAHRALAMASLALLSASIVHGVGVMLVTAGSLPQRLDALLGADALLVWPVTIVAAWLLWRGHTRAMWLSAAVGFVTAATLIFDDAPVWWRSSAPSAWPAAANRAGVAMIVGLGLGLVVALPLLARRFRAPTRAWPGVAAEPSSAELEPPTTPHATPPHATPPHATLPHAEPAVNEPAVDEPAVGEPVVGAGVPRRLAVGYLAAGAIGALAGAAGGASAVLSRTGAAPASTTTPLSDVGARIVPFYGQRQAGIATPARPQACAWVAGFDVDRGVNLEALRGLLRRWSDAAARLTAGQGLDESDDAVVAGLGPAALTITIGFGPTLFGQAGVPDSARPEALAPLPAFADERLDGGRSGGDLGVVVAGDDTVVVSHAARVLRRLARDGARLRWQMRGFNAARGSVSPATPAGGGEDGLGTPRNLMGQVDGTNNPRRGDPDFAARIFATAPGWLRDGSYLVVRRIRMLLDDWDTLAPAEQERVIGRRRDSGAPLSGGGERTPPDFGARDGAGGLVIPTTAHMRLAAPAFNGGAAMLRRPFSYTEGDETGLLFLAWQADPRRGFIPVQRRLVEADALGRFIRHETSALFAMPGGARPGGYVGQDLLESLGVRR